MEIDTTEHTPETRMKERETLRWLVSQFRATFLLLIFASLGQTLLSGVGVFSAFCSRDLIDAAVSGTRERFIEASVVLFTTLFASIAVSMFNNAVAERLRARAEMALQRKTLGTLLSKDYTATTSRHTGDLLNRLTSDVKVVTTGLASIVPSLVAFTTRLAFAFAALCYFDAKLALIFFCMGICVFVGATVFRKRLKELHKAMQDAEGRKRSFWQEALTNLFAVKAFSRETEIQDRSDRLVKDHYDTTMKRRNFGLVVGGGLHTLFSCGYFGALVWQSYHILLGTATFGSTVAVLQLVNNVQSPFAGLSNLVPYYYNAIASAERIRELENLQDEAGSDAQRLDGQELFDALEAIVFENVSFTYKRRKKEVQVFRGASFEIPKGKNVVVCGRSGIGKSTLFKLLTGVCKPDSGRIYLRTKFGETPVDSRTRALFSLVPQGNMLFSGSIAENIAFFRDDEDNERVAEAAETAGAEFIETLPEGFQTTIGEKAAGLSEGQAQRLAIARSVRADAPIVLLDEATSALDPKTEYEVLTKLTKESNKTLVWISHRPAAFQFADIEIKIDGEKCGVSAVETPRALDA